MGFGSTNNVGFRRWVYAEGDVWDASGPSPPRLCCFMTWEFPEDGAPPPWYRRRGYPHFDVPIGVGAAVALATDPSRVARHAFFPFISYESETPRYSRGERKVIAKKRPIAYAAHADSHIFAYYSSVLAKKLEDRISASEIGECVLAYRRFAGGKNNAHFAAEVFERIAAVGACDVVAMDVEGFFDNLCHDRLKGAWADLIGESPLPGDHYAVFRAVTRYAKVDRKELYVILGIGRRRAECIRGPVCSVAEFRTKVRAAGLVVRHAKPHGIPQGSPISATLSNIYLLDFDVAMNRCCIERGAIYRRYSDDILVICRPGEGEAFEDMVASGLERRRLKLSTKKTQISRFRHGPEGQLSADRPLQYLGFTFDGCRKLIRAQTLSRYHRNMKQAIASASRAARKASTDLLSPTRLYRRELYKRYSHLGDRNLPSYAIRSAMTMNSPDIRRQIRKHWRQLHDRIREAENEVR